MNRILKWPLNIYVYIYIIYYICIQRLMWYTQCHKLPCGDRFYPPGHTSDDVMDGLFLGLPHYGRYVSIRIDT